MDTEVRRANILEINPDASGERIFAAGIRNPVGMGWQPESGRLWTAVNERDNLGDELRDGALLVADDAGGVVWRVLRVAGR